MAVSTDDALRTLDQSYKDILVQIGKHFKIAAKDGLGALEGTNSAIQLKISESLSQYHLAVNQIEGEVRRAQSVLERDLEKLRAARAPPPVTAPVPTPVPTPVPAPAPVPVIGQQTGAPPAPMMELPSAAAHSHTLNAAPYPPGMEAKTVAPFPDMGGMGISGDIGDVTGGGKKPSPRVQHGSVRAVPRTAPSAGLKPSPKPAPKPTPPKVTPVPPPQIPQIPRPAFQASGAPSQAKPQTQTAIPPPKPPQPILPPQQAPAARMAPDNASGAMAVPPSGAGGDGTIHTGGNNELTFTEMEFSLVPPPAESQGAPPAPMSEFDLSGFVADTGNNKPTAPTNTTNTSNPVSSNPAETQNNSQIQNMNMNMDDLFNLGDANGGGDNMFDLGGGEVNDSTFEDMMYFGNNDSDMAQFDDAYFGL